jgi:hypothetical protein
VYHVSFLHTQVGIATIDICRSLGDSQTKSARIKRTLPASLDFIRSVTEAVILTDALDDDGCEVLFGSAGLLYALLKIRSEAHQKDSEAVSMLISDTTIERVISLIVQKGRLGARIYAQEYPTSNPALMWRWHGKRYLGACHGVGKLKRTVYQRVNTQPIIIPAGILHVLLLSPRHLIEPYIPEILATVSFLLRLQDETGNFPTKAPDTSRGVHTSANELVQSVH